MTLRVSAAILLTAAAYGCASVQPTTDTSTTISSRPVTSVLPPGPLPPPTYQPQFGTMWTFEAPPLDYWKKTYGFAPDQKWLDHIRLSSIRLPNCSASFVSANGLVMTNHHCARDCTDAVSPKDSNYIETGFAAAKLSDEKKCEGLYVDQLISIEPVTDKVRAAITGSTPAQQAQQRSQIVSQLQQQCSQSTGLTCQVVSLYQGGIYSMYRYKRFSDLRLVMVPEDQIAAFGGDPDNFTFPRYNLDLALLRVYENGAPYHPTDYLKWSANGAGDGEPIFIVGNPGSTGRLNTLAQMEFLRDVTYPGSLGGYKRALTIYDLVQKQDTSAARRYQNQVFSIQNSQKAIGGYRRGLIDSVRMAQKRAFEAEFRARINADPALRAKYGFAWDSIAAAERQLGTFAAQSRNYGFGPSATLAGSQLLAMASQIVRLANESAKPDESRLLAYRGMGLENIKRSLLGDRRVDLPLEKLSLAAQFRFAQQELPANDPFLAAALAGRTPESAADALVSGTKLGDVNVRKALVEGGAAAVAASDDPMIRLARAIDPLNRGVVARTDSLNAIITANAERVGQALFAIYGTTLPPDATFTLRISDGVVRDYPANGTITPYKTTFYGLYERAAAFDNKPPFNLPQRWIARRDRLNLSTPFDFVSTNDITGGNSGSPVVNRNGEVIGLAFDSNIEGVASRFLLDPEVDRMIGVHSAGIVEAIRKMYDGARIADELQGR
ncbi:MAG TPA: S46 family peptidase [Gemmatimonadaceae bacterium]|nr:S46 family peptidase [Gemmatimonadaceae bacterium]